MLFDGPSPFTIKNDAYLLISDALFNGSIINKTGDGNINQSGIFESQKDLDVRKKIVLSSRPPVVRVMYNLNGEIILGNNNRKNLCFMTLKVLSYMKLKLLLDLKKIPNMFFTEIPLTKKYYY